MYRGISAPTLLTFTPFIALLLCTIVLCIRRIAFKSNSFSFPISIVSNSFNKKRIVKNEVTAKRRCLYQRQARQSDFRKLFCVPLQQLSSFFHFSHRNTVTENGLAIQKIALPSLLYSKNYTSIERKLSKAFSFPSMFPR